MRSTTLKLRFEGLDPRLSYFLSELGGEALCRSEPEIEQKDLYPASWVKLFWAVQAFLVGTPCSDLIFRLLAHSSDQAGQELVDFLVGTDSEDYPETKCRRQLLTSFWEERGYAGIGLGHKTFLGEYSALDAWLREDLGPNKISFAQIHKLWSFVLLENNLKPEQREIFLSALTRKATSAPEIPDTPNFQASLLGFGFGFPESFTFLAKAGWRDWLVCDSACFSLQGGRKVLVSVQADFSSQEASIAAIRGYSARLFEVFAEEGLIENISH